MKLFVFEASQLVVELQSARASSEDKLGMTCQMHRGFLVKYKATDQLEE